MKKVLLGSMLIVSCFAFGQKVKFKKGVVSADDKPIFHYVDDSSLSATISTLENIEFVRIMGSTILGQPGSYIYTVRFIKSGKELLTDLDYRSIVKNLFTSKVIEENGDLNEENVDLFINKFNDQNLKFKLTR